MPHAMWAVRLTIRASRSMAGPRLADRQPAHGGLHRSFLHRQAGRPAQCGTRQRPQLTGAPLRRDSGLRIGHRFPSRQAAPHFAAIAVLASISTSRSAPRPFSRVISGPGCCRRSGSIRSSARAVRPVAAFLPLESARPTNRAQEMEAPFRLDCEADFKVGASSSLILGGAALGRYCGSPATLPSLINCSCGVL